MRRTGPVPVAVIVPSPELLKQMLDEKPPCWAWASFASVMFNRWAALEERKIRQVCGGPVRPAGRLDTGREVAAFVAQHLRSADDISIEVQAYLCAPAFAAAFGAEAGEGAANAEAIVQAAHDVSDRYEELLQLAEDCRRFSVPDQYADLMHDCAKFMNTGLQDFGGFMNDILERLEQLQVRAAAGHGDTGFDPVPLRITTEERLLGSILDGLHAIG